VGMVSPSASAKHQSEVLQLTAWGRSRALIQALIAEAHRAFQVPPRAAYRRRYLLLHGRVDAHAAASDATPILVA